MSVSACGVDGADKIVERVAHGLRQQRAQRSGVPHAAVEVDDVHPVARARCAQPDPARLWAQRVDVARGDELVLTFQPHLEDQLVERDPLPLAIFRMLTSHCWPYDWSSHCPMIASSTLPPALGLRRTHRANWKPPRTSSPALPPASVRPVVPSSARLRRRAWSYRCRASWSKIPQPRSRRGQGHRAGRAVVRPGAPWVGASRGGRPYPPMPGFPRPGIAAGLDVGRLSGCPSPETPGADCRLCPWARLVSVPVLRGRLAQGGLPNRSVARSR
jgi:hypothetical protein